MIPPRKALKQIIDDEKSCSLLLYDCGILLPVTICPEDSFSVKQISEFKYKCKIKSHRTIYSLLTNIIFAHIRIPLTDFMHIGYLWLAKTSFSTISTITGHGTQTITRMLKLISKQS